MTPKKTTTRRAAKKTAKRKAAGKRGTIKELRELTKKARTEVEELLAHIQPGSVPPDLQSKLEKIDDDLKVMEIFEHKL